MVGAARPPRMAGVVVDPAELRFFLTPET